MEHLCVGSYVRIMTSCAIPAERKFDPFCEKIMLSLCPAGAKVFSYTSADGYEVTYSYTNFNKIHSASQNLPTEVMQMALKKDARAIERYFVQTIIPAMEEARKKNAVLALKNVILKDSTIADTTQLGTIGDLTKSDLKSKNDFVLSEFLTDVFIYAVAKTDNLVESAFTKSIKKDFYTAYNQMVDTIKFYEVTRPKGVAAIPLTSKGKFDKVFMPVSSETLSISAKHDLQIFCLKFDDFDFDYHGLWRHLRNNIGYYVYSRAQIETYMEDDEISALAYDAIAYIKKAIADGKLPTGNELGELLLYIFLEQVLIAPKLMSKVEIGNHGGFMTSESSCIHLLTANDTVPFSEVVLGTSMINGDLQAAIDAAFADAQKLKDRKKDERRFVEMFGDVIHNSKKWQVCLFAEITSSRLGKMLDAKQQTGRNSYPYLANFNVQWFRFNLENLNKMDFDEKDRAEFELREGDLLVCEGGEIGRCAVWHNELQPCFFQKALHRVRCNHQIILPDYLAWWFRYNCDYGGFSALAGAKATIAHLPGAKLKQLQVAVPPMELQEQFAVFVAQTDKSKVAVRKY